MIKNKLIKIKKKLIKYKIDGYIVPKNDEFFSEYVKFDRLKIISNFDGSAGLAIILKNKNYLFVDGRYTIQAKKQSGTYFKIIEIHKFLPHQILKNLNLGYDPKLFTKSLLNYYFRDKIKLIPIKENLVAYQKNEKISSNNKFYSIPNNIAGKNFKNKINLVSNLIKKNKADYLFVTAPENIAWLLNIRGNDTPFSPMPNCNLLMSKNKKINLIVNEIKTTNLVKQKKISKKNIINPKKFSEFIQSLSGKNIIIDRKTCSIFNEQIIEKKFKIKNYADPCYYLKSLKNSSEIKYMQKAHLEDGIALTKFIYWMKNLKNKKITEIKAQKKLEEFRKQNKNYLYPSFSTIAGTGSNGAIVHYRATKETNKEIKKKDIFLCDSGGQYKYGTTDVTRTICFTKPSDRIRNIFTKVLKGHIAVATCNINKFNTGSEIDIKARKYLKSSGLDYAHGTGHGVGFFSNVHEGPQSISKFNKIKLKEGMILSNEPGYYEEGKFGIRIENLVFVKKFKGKLSFENLTIAPIDKNLINFKLLNKNEKEYLVKYHLFVYSKLSKFLNKQEKKWLIRNI